MSRSRRLKNSHLIGICGICGIISMPAWSQTDTGAAAAATATDLQEVTVSAKKLEEEIPQELAKYGTRVDIITAKQIAEGGYTDVAAALGALAPGLYINPKNGPFDYVDASLQGSRTEDILWMVDGVRINNRLYAGTTPLDTIPASIIERIEVIEGGQALFYGTEAIAGAVNIVTKSFTNTADGAVTIAGDTNTGKHADAYARNSVGNSQFVAYVSADRSDGFQPFRDQDYQPSGTDHQRPYEVLTEGIKYAYNFTDDFRITADEQHTNATLDYASPFLTYDEFNDRTEDLATVKLDAKFSDTFQMFIKSYYHLWQSYVTEEYNTIPPSSTIDVIYNHAPWGYDDYGTNVLTQIKPGGPLEYFAGYDLQEYAGSDASLVITKHTESTNAVFGQVRTSNEFSEKLKLSAGLRYNVPSDGQSATIWTATGEYDFNPHVFVRGEAGTSFRLPTDEELYANDPNDERGDPNLKPEKGTNTNFSVGGSEGSDALQANWELIGFYREVRDLIDYASFDAATDQAVFGNVPGTVITRGGEATLNATLDSVFSLNLSYTYAAAKDPTTGQQVARVPKEVAKAGLNYNPTSQPWSAGITVNYFGTTTYSGLWDGTETYGNAVVVNLSGRYYLDTARHQHVDVAVVNLFDKQYATGLGSGVRDADGSNYTYQDRGEPRTLRVAYTYQF
jgi:outer membrane cobalamin receptor